ncbi:hypothetical protein [Pseudomonas nicosulfuronedens]
MFVPGLEKVQPTARLPDRAQERTLSAIDHPVHQTDEGSGLSTIADKVRLYESDKANVQALALEVFQKNIRTRRMPRSGGLVEAEFQGLSDMDVARALSGQGWPVSVCP